eukprot:TRINITY_DN62092_c0_g1_i1.p1 TRINITY_DN62092_c0_g1~~TRINITY_DN62092_c0_g1_i1.p1  ORF type:complete len:378 (-),score=33.08 TRINITY_DN62092_c0_g1_i1:397-1530(-)
MSDASTPKTTMASPFCTVGVGWGIVLVAVTALASMSLVSGSKFTPRSVSVSSLASGGESTGGKMYCGHGVRLCGVLALETGHGRGPYESASPVVHGLWPENGHFGDSQCLEASDAQPPSKLFTCYDQKERSHSKQISFQHHEWKTHGMCAGVSSADDYFTQVCDLASAPLAVMGEARSNGVDLDGTVSALVGAGFWVWERKQMTSEVLLSACAGQSGRWVLSPPHLFSERCKWSSGFEVPFSGHGGNDRPAASAGSCLPSKHGPSCTSEGDCAGLSGCVRCAKSGYCTDVPLRSGASSRGSSLISSGVGANPGRANAICVPGQKGPACSSDATCSSLTGCARCAKSGYCTDVALGNLGLFPIQSTRPSHSGREGLRR